MLIHVIATAARFGRTQKNS